MAPRKVQNKLLPMMYFLLAIVLLSILTLLIVMVVYWTTGKFEPVPTTTPVPDVSHAKGWLKAASYLNQSIDTTADPCQDFYKYACGKWIRNNPIPASLGSVDPAVITTSEVYLKLAYSYKNLPAKSSKSIFQASQIFNSCQNFDPSTLHGPNNPLLKLLNKFGGWPMITPNWNSNIPIWSAVAKLSRMYGVHTLITPTYEADWENPSEPILYLDQATLGLGNPGFYLDTNIGKSAIAKLQAEIISVAGILANDSGTYQQQQAVIQSSTRFMILLERILAENVIAKGERRDFSKMYNRMAVRDLQMQYPFVDWIAYLTPFFSNFPVGDLPDQIVVVKQPSYFKWLGSFLAISDNKKLLNYLMWRLVSSRSSFLNGSSASQLPMIEYCAKITVNTMPYASGSLYVRNYFTQSLRDEAKLIITNILAAFTTIITGVKWMELSSTIAADQKISQLISNIGYPDWILNNTLLDQYYAGFNVSGANWPEIYDNTLISVQNLYWNRRIFRNDFGISPAAVRGKYSLTSNSVSFPAAILQLPFFDPSLPKAWNYGSVGSWIAHEILHQFNDEGVQFGSEGSLSYWLDANSYTNFTQTVQCVQNEYSNFCINSSTICVNGLMTQGENMADNGGIKASYQAYQDYAFSNGPEPRLPGYAKLSLNQVFFVSFAHRWCEKISEESLLDDFMMGPYTPAKYRVIGTVRNFPAFGKAFKCKLGDPMYPKTACDVW